VIGKGTPREGTEGDGVIGVSSSSRLDFHFPRLTAPGRHRTRNRHIVAPYHPTTLSPYHPVRLLYFSPTGAHSSVGQSARFTSVRSQVQVLLRPPRTPVLTLVLTVSPSSRLAGSRPTPDSVSGTISRVAARPACRQTRSRAAWLDRAGTDADNCAAIDAPSPWPASRGAPTDVRTPLRRQ
jgi:hypothetical protein